MPVETIENMRDRFLPMLRYVQEEYRFRVPEGYPIIHDDSARGLVGIEIDPAHSLYLTNDGEGLYIEVTYRSSRYDARSSASREKFGGKALVDRRPLPVGITDHALRNLLAELMSRFNSQQTILYITDT